MTVALVLDTSALPECTLRKQDRSPTAAISAEDREAVRLSRGVARHDPKIAGEFYDAWLDWCIDRVRRLTQRDETFCMDVVQEAMLKAIRSMPEFAEHDDMTRWMRRVVEHAAIDLLRAERRRAQRERAVCERRGEASPAPPEDLEDDVAWLEAQLKGCTPEELASVRVRFVQEGTLLQAGRAAGQSLGQTHGQLRRFLERLRRAPRSTDHE